MYGTAVSSLIRFAKKLETMEGSWSCHTNSVLCGDRSRRILAYSGFLTVKMAGSLLKDNLPSLSKSHDATISTTGGINSAILPLRPSHREPLLLLYLAECYPYYTL